MFLMPSIGSSLRDGVADIDARTLWHCQAIVVSPFPSVAELRSDVGQDAKREAL